MGNKWLKYGIALVAGIPVALCLSMVCCGTSSLPADILEDDWRWMYACGIFSGNYILIYTNYVKTLHYICILCKKLLY